MLAALFWKRSTKWGALAVTLWAGSRGRGRRDRPVHGAAAAPARRPVLVELFGVDVVTRGAGGLAVLNLMPVVPMTLISAFLMWMVSVLTPKPAEATIARYFEAR